jgi:hypothetical protein
MSTARWSAALASRPTISWRSPGFIGDGRRPGRLLYTGTLSTGCAMENPQGIM